MPCVVTSLHLRLSVYSLYADRIVLTAARAQSRASVARMSVSFPFCRSRSSEESSMLRAEADKPLHLLERRFTLVHDHDPVLSDDRAVRTPLGAENHSDRHVSKCEGSKRRTALLASRDESRRSSWMRGKGENFLRAVLTTLAGLTYVR